MTLLELLIILAILFIIFFIAIPTINPPKVSDVESFAKRRLRYLYERERAYFLRNGFYNSFAELAKDENGGPFLDRRYRDKISYTERGITFVGPSGKTDELEILAKLPGNLGTLVIDRQGKITRKKEKEDQASPFNVPDFGLPGETAQQQATST